MYYYFSKVEICFNFQNCMVDYIWQQHEPCRLNVKRDEEYADWITEEG